MAAAARTLTQRELNRALLARQLLLERARASIPKALERVAGLQAQYAPSMYVGLWTRLERFERDQLNRALERAAVVQGTLMRMTIHLVSPRDYWPFATAIRRRRRESWLKSHRGLASPAEMAAAARRVRRLLADGPRRRADIEGLIGGGAAMSGGVGMWLDLVRVPPSGTWERRRADLYGAAEDWLGAAEVGPAQAEDHLVRSYLRGFGPASRKDVASWTGLPLVDVARVLERLELRRFRDESGEELLDVPRAPLPDADVPAPVRFLPVWDATLLVHARRTGILPERYRPLIFNTKTPHSVNTFLVDGAVAGTWTFEGGRVRLEPFERLDRAARRELEEEAERLAAFHA